MRKSILRFGALALMSLMSISSWAQSIVYDGVNNLYSVVEGTNVKLQSLIAPSSGNALNLSNGFTVGSGNSAVTYTVVGVVAYASNTYSGSDITVTLPSNLSEGVGEFAFAKQGVKVQFKDQTLKGTLSNRAFENATIVSGDVTNPVFHFNDLTLSDHAFYNAAFPTGTSIVLSATLTELPDYVFGASSTKSDITRVEFNYPGSITRVGNYALKDRAALKQFGFYTNGNYSLPVTLNEVGDYSFTSCNQLTNFGFSTEAINGENRPRIATIGKYAFYGCNSWMDNAKFTNLCVSFNELTFGEGSFQSCNFTSVDLSNWTPIDVTIGTEEAKNIQTGKGVPGGAFADNTNLTSLNFGDTEIKVIGEFAFYNTGLTNLVLPKGIEYLGTSAFALGTTQTTHNEIISLPTTLKGIREDALKNRYIDKIFVSPDFSYTGFNVPQLENQAGLTVASMQLPTVKRNPKYDDEGTIVDYDTPKKVFENAGWKSVSGNKTITLAYASEFSATPADGYYYYVDYDGVKYKIDPTPNGDYGYFNATVVAFTENSATVHGMLQTKEVKYDEKENNNTVQKTATLKGGIYDYSNIVLNVKDFAVTEGQSPVSDVGYPKDTENVCTMTKVTFDRDAKAIAQDGDVDVAQDFVGISGTNYATIPASLFVFNSPELTSVTLAEGITNVGASAFYGTQINAITLPKTLTTIGAKAFATSSLETVNVSYATVPSSGITTPFATYETGKPNAGRCIALLNVSKETGAATREAYRNETAWASFFGGDATIQYKDDPTAGFKYVASDVVYEDGNLVDTYVLKDGVAEVQVTDDESNANLNIRYDRNFAYANWQCWYVPFDFEFTSSDEYEFAELYDTQLNGEETVFEYRKVKPGEDVIIKANIPYVIKPKEAKAFSFYATGIEATPTSDPTFTVSNAEYTYTFTSIYSRKTATNTDKDWYAINAKDPNCLFEKASFFANLKDGTSSFLNAYRFYMTISNKDDYPYAAPSPNVKFVVLDEDEVTAIENVKVNSLNAPMFDLQGRQIVAPAKGQVYIQNGVKKLAR